jgi:hypothetical protein
MRHLRHIAIAAFAAALGVYAAAPAAAASQTAALGAHGEVYSVVSGNCAQIFSAMPGCPANHRVLALEIQRPGAPTQKTLVPSTEDFWPEDSASLLYEDSSDSLFIVWESWWNGIHPQLNLASYGPEGWSEVVEVSGSPFTEKRSPQLAVTRDSYAGADPEAPAVQRTVVHLIWREGFDQASDQLRYSPLVLEDGVFIGSNEVFDLAAVAGPADDGGSAAGPMGPMTRAAAIQAAKEPGAVTVGYGDAASGRFFTLQIKVVPGEVSVLARQMFAWIDDRLAAGGPIDMEALAHQARLRLLELGAHLHPAFVGYLADQVFLYLSQLDPGVGLEPIAGGVHDNVLELGAQLSGEGLVSITGPRRGIMIDVGLRHSPRGNHELVEILSDRPLPATGPGPVLVFLSGSGHNALVAWEAQGELRYRETTPGAWGDVHSLEIGPRLSFDQAIEVLKQRIWNR